MLNIIGSSFDFDDDAFFGPVTWTVTDQSDETITVVSGGDELEIRYELVWDQSALLINVPCDWESGLDPEPTTEDAWFWRKLIPLTRPEA